MKSPSALKVLKKSFQSLRDTKVAACFAVPLLTAFLSTILIFLLFGFENVASYLTEFLISVAQNFVGLFGIQLSSLTDFLSATSQVLHVVFLLFMFLPLFYFISSLVASVIAGTFLINYIAQKDYPQLVKRGRFNLFKSVFRSIVFSLIFLVLSLLTLPAVFFPVVGYPVQVLLTAWLSKKSFSYDVLSEWASPEEFNELFQQNSKSAYPVSILSASTIILPFAFVVSPLFTGLVLTHFYMSQLSDLRKHHL